MGAMVPSAVSQRKQSQANDDQCELALRGGVVRGGLNFLSEDELSECETFERAFDYCMARRRARNRTQGDVADYCGIDRATFSRIVRKPGKRPAYFPEHKYRLLCEALGNLGMLQWFALQAGCRLTPAVETQAQRQRRALALLEAQERATHAA